MGNSAQPQSELVLPERLVVPEPKQPAWSLPQRILFRFLFAYLVLYIAPTLLNSIPGVSWAARFYFQGWRAMVPWVAIHVFHLSGQAVTYFPTGSGDTTLAYVQNFCDLVFALAATLVWSVADRKRGNYCKLHGWLRIAVRYALAITMFGYGFAKLFPLQFRVPGFVKLMEPYGEFSPMGVLWSFMGSSPAYTIFSGALETLGGLLLLFRRTATLGAIVCSAVLLNIVMLNLCYDVPVKIYSMNLLFQAIFLMAPDLRRILNLLVLNRAAEAADLGRLPLGRRWMQWAAAGVKVLFIGSLLFNQISGGWERYKQVRNLDKPPLYGLYEVEKFTRNGRELPPLTTDASRWRKVAIQFPGAITVRAMDDTLLGYTAEYGKGANTVSLSRGAKAVKSVFTYSRPDENHVLLAGTMADDTLSISLRQIDTSKFLLMSRGFHWISEAPFNR
jgi:uncharacterized membrane protein YphA (DoxX/SURF4 family)